MLEMPIKSIEKMREEKEKRKKKIKIVINK
jgi:hypothetical protein